MGKERSVFLLDMCCARFAFLLRLTKSKFRMTKPEVTILRKGLDDQVVIESEYDFSADIAKVQVELIFFRDQCLPAFLDGDVDESQGEAHAQWVQKKIHNVAGQLSDWLTATNRLSDFLPLGPLTADSPKLSRNDFTDFLFQEASPHMSVQDGKINWQIRLFMSPEISTLYCTSCPESPMNPEKFQARLPQVQSWLLSLPVDSLELCNALCYILPFVADADPAFAKLTLDPDTWRTLTLNNPDITEDERKTRLQMIEGYFAHVLNNALLHVFGSLANNHFLLIADYLDHPRLRGGYCHLKPHYLFAVLFEKVAILRALAGK